MKTIIIPVLIAAMFKTAYGIGIEDAFNKGLIQYVISGTSEGNTGACIAVDITNMSSTVVNLEIETGRILEADDSLFQNMIVSKRFFARLQPKQRVSQKMYALCAEPSDATPNTNIKFSHGSMATGVLLGMVKFVEANNLQNSEGQSFIWSIVRGNTTFYDCDYTKAMYASLKTFFSADRTIKFEHCETVNKRPAAENIRTVRRYKGNFSFSLPQPSDIEISIFDDEGNKVKQLEHKKQMEADWYEYDYEFTDANLTKGKSYELKLLINGKPKKVIYIDTN